MILIGTCHYDMQGPERLMHLLRKYQPRTVTIEYPKGTGIDEAKALISQIRRKRNEEVGRSCIPEKMKRLFLEISNTTLFELDIAVQYYEETGSDLHFVDHPDIDSTDYMMGEDIVSFLNDLSEQNDWSRSEAVPYEAIRDAYVKMVDQAYYSVENLKKCAEGVKIKDSKASEELKKWFKRIKDPDFQEKREQHMADEIVARRSELHVGGGDHVFHYAGFVEVTPLYQRLGKYVSKRIRLCEAMNE